MRFSVSQRRFGLAGVKPRSRRFKPGPRNHDVIHICCTWMLYIMLNINQPASLENPYRMQQQMLYCESSNLFLRGARAMKLIKNVVSSTTLRVCVFLCASMIKELTIFLKAWMYSVKNPNLSFFSCTRWYYLMCIYKRLLHDIVPCYYSLHSNGTILCSRVCLCLKTSSVSAFLLYKILGDSGE